MFEYDDHVDADEQTSLVRPGDRRSDGLEESKSLRCVHRWRDGIGLILLLLSTLMYVGSSVVTQIIFHHQEYEKPFFLSYFSIGLCGVYLVELPFRSSLFRRQRPRNLGSLQSDPGTEAPRTSIRDLLIFSLRLGPFYFGLNYFYFGSLQKTSVSSTNVLSSSSALWTILINHCVQSEPLSVTNVVAVFMSFLGIILVVHGNSGHEEDEGHETMIGDMMAVAGAMINAGYTVLLKKFIPDDNSVPMTLVFGFMGLTTVILWAPMFGILHYTGLETFEMPSHVVWLTLIANALIGTVLPDMLFSYAVLMTSPLIANVGVSLTVPIAMITDMWRGTARLNTTFIMGSVSVWVAFVLVNVSAKGIAKRFNWLSQLKY